jgi:ABC-type multidrug transport system fused ATPase/permease subunit
LVVAALTCALVQASFEGASFALLGDDGMAVAIESTIGNTITHGIIGGAIPLVLIVPRFAGRLERFLGFEPKEWAGPDPLADAPAPAAAGADSDDAPVALDRFTFAYPGTSEPALRDVTLRLAPGEVAGVVGIVGAEGSGRTTLGMALAGLTIGTGRSAYQTPVGQVGVLIALAVIVACWVWAGRLMRLPEERRVFAE